MSTRSSAWAATAVLTAAFPAGCESDVAEPPSDSRDVILEQEWVVDGYAADLVPIDWVVAAPNGDAFVAQWQDSRILAYDANGQLRGMFGSEGQGPGEFQSMAFAGLVGDTLWVLDARQGRVTLIDTRTLELARTIPVPWEVPLSGDQGDFRVLGFFFSGITPDGSTYAQLTGESPRGSLTRHVITDIDGGPMRVIVDDPEDPGTYTYRTNDGRAFFFRTPYLQRSFFSLNDDATRYAYLRASIDGPDAGTYRVDAWDARGDTVYSRTYPFALAEIPTAVADSAMEATAAVWERRSGAGAAYRSMVPSPRVFPPVEDLVVGNDGSMWIQLRSLEPSETRYEVLDPVGDQIGVITLDRDVRIAATTSNHVWAVATDSLEVESVVKFAIVRE